MISLGSITVARESSVYEARRKVRQVVEKLTGDPLVATRLATAASELARGMARGEGAGRIDAAVRRGNGGASFVLSAVSGAPLPDLERVNGFFDEVRRPDDSEQDHVLECTFRLPDSASVDGGSIARLKEIVEEKGRDELLWEIGMKNEELQESLDNLKRTRSAKERMESELNIGREIQMSMLPLSFPAFPDRSDFDVYATLAPAREVGGDFYDLFLIDDQHFCFGVGDVSGKGVPAALFMAVTKTLIKSRAANDLSPASILSHVNTELSRHNDACMFVTIFLAILDLESGRMVYTNAGHNPPYIKRTTGDLVRLDSRHGPILGAKTGLAYGEDRVQLQPDDLVFLYTDGVTEAMNAPEELYTEARLRGLLESSRLDSVEEAVRVMVDDVWDYQGDAEQADDVTVLAASWLGQEDAGEHRLQLTVTNQPEEIDRVNEAFTAFAGSHDLPKEVRRKMSLVFDELLNNIISYAYEDEGEHLIEVTASVLGRRLVVTLTDDGRAFNPFDQEAPDTGVSLDDREIGGLGVHLVKSLMDSVVYERRGMKNVLTLEKALASEEAPDH
jgi:sigma-B regulation protein RsbU (phosphoserine phosphatase)